MAERVQGNPKEIKFYGEKAASIRFGFAITSLRNPNPNYEFTPGERVLADCVDDNEKVPVIVVSNETKPLWQYSESQLMLDGFYSAEDAAYKMRVYPGYEETTKNSELQAITFVYEDAFADLDLRIQGEIINPKNSFEDLIRIPELRHLFFPTIAETLIRNGRGISYWMDFLIYEKLVTPQEIKRVKESKLEGINFYNYFSREYPGRFPKMFSHPDSITFKALVCLQPDKNYRP